MRGLGSDLIEIERIRTSIGRHGLHFLNRLFSQKEQDYCYQFKDPSPHFAGRFAAKEAIAKALGTGFGTHLRWLDLEILNDELGKPIVHFSVASMERFQKPHVLLTISHSATHALAVAIVH
ncbi:MAG: holo-ACP synthase [Chlamydiia bacterium]|nr:holo-ACP synthase [Chlamydiia bacterium]